MAICGLAYVALLAINKYAILSSLTNFNDIETILPMMYVPFCVGVFIVLGLVYSRDSFQKIEYKNFKFIVYISLILSLFINFITQSNVISKGPYGFLWDYRLFLIFLLLGLVLLNFFKSRKIPYDRLKTAGIPLLLIMPLVAFYLELTNILNQHNIFIVRRLLSAKLLAVSLFFIFVLLCFIKLKKIRNWELIYCVGIVLGLSFFTLLPPLQITATTELFEQANHGMLVYDFIHYGRIPLLESFDGHMLSFIFGGIIYNLFNGINTIDGSYFQYAFFNPFINVFIFLILAKQFNKHIALFVILFVPILHMGSEFNIASELSIGLELDMGLELMIVLAFIKAITKRSILWWGLYTTFIAMVAFYEFPQGVVLGIGSMILCILIIFSEVIKERKFTVDFKNFIIGNGIAIGSFISIYLILCFVKGVDPLSRGLEFVSLVNSNRNWAYASIDDNTSMLFALTYALTPIVAIALLSGVFYKIFIKNEKNNLPLLITMVFLLAYFSNFTRMLGRHSLEENIFSIGIMYVLFALMFVGAAFKSKIKLQLFIPMLFNGMSTQKTYAANSLLQNTLSIYNDYRVYHDGATEKIVRVNYDDVEAAHSSVISVIKTTLLPDETYMDLTSNTMLYALTGKEKPVYINQSLLHLSGDYTQRQFINQIESYGDKVPYALLGSWKELDGIKNDIRYYQVCEYLNSEFKPLIMLNTTEYSLWVRKEKYEEVSRRLQIQETSDAIEIVIANVTDEKWDNGLLRSNRKVLLSEKSFPSIEKAEELLINGTKKLSIESVEIKDDNWQYIHFFDEESAIEAANAESVIYKGVVQEWSLINYSNLNHTHTLGNLALY